MKKVAFYTLGCRVNQYETESIKKQFAERGYEVVPFDSFADVYVVNTCTVTSIADKKNRNMLRRPKKINSNSIVVATGCYAQTNHRDLAKMSDVDLIVGQKQKGSIANLVEDFSLYEGKRKSFVGNVFKYENYSEIDFAGLRDLDKAFFKIQDGCDRFCSFCKIPFARGQKRSRNLHSILQECKMLVEEGFKEIVLIGIHLGAYGEDLEESCSLDDVVEKLLEIEGLERLRISSIYPDTVTDRFVELMQHPKLMPHLHVSIQSADDNVLKLMNRRYDSSLMYEVFNKLKSKVRDVAFTGDIIVGFPGEDENAFINTFNFVKEFNFSDLHIFPYSDRERTVAKSLPNKVDNIVKYERFKRLNLLRKSSQNSFMKRFLGKKMKILIESERKDSAKGYTENFLRAAVDTKAKSGSIIEFVPEYIVNGIFYGREL